jgi:hypothetical protein
MERIDEAGNIIGFSVMNVSGFSPQRHGLGWGGLLFAQRAIGSHR